jgi:hypothetical protein
MSSAESDATMDTEPTAPVQKSRFEDVLDVFFSPTALFERRRNDKIGPPLLILMALTLVFYYVLLPAQTMLVRASMANMPPEAAAKMETVGKFMAIGGGIMAPIAVAIGVAITAVLLWLLARLVDAKPDFQQMMIVAIYAGFIGLVGQIAIKVAVMIHGEAGLDMMRHTSFGVLRFVDAKSLPSALPGLLARIDIFKIWEAVIWAIGFRVVTGVSKQKAAIVAAAAWFIYAIPGMLGGGAMSKMGNVEIKTGD